MSKVFHGETHAIIPYIDAVTGQRNYISMRFNGSVCKKRILREIRKHMKHTYDRSFPKDLFRCVGFSNSNVYLHEGPTPQKYKAFYAWLQHMIDEETERRANKDNGDTTLQADNT